MDWFRTASLALLKIKSLANFCSNSGMYFPRLTGTMPTVQPFNNSLQRKQNKTVCRQTLKNTLCSRLFASCISSYGDTTKVESKQNKGKENDPSS